MAADFADVPGLDPTAVNCRTVDSPGTVLVVELLCLLLERIVMVMVAGDCSWVATDW